jgi:hypothetical protein
LPTAPEVPEVQETEEVLEIEQTPEETPSVEEPTSVPESALEEQPVSLLRLFMPRAQAQEIEAEETVEADVGPVVKSEASPESTLTPETDELVEETDNAETGEVLGIDTTTIAPDDNTTAETTPYGIVEFLYTLDGLEWKSLGFVERHELNSKYFEIPVEEASDWEDISKIQIGVQSVPVVDGVVPVMYLDSVWLEVGYGDAEELIIEEKVLSEEEAYEEVVEDEEEVVLEEFEEEYIEPLPLLSTRIFTDEIVVDPNATHSCKAEPFIVDISNKDLLSTFIALERPIGDTYDYRVEIGGLPNGIDIVFENNSDYEYRPDPSQDTLVLDIQNEEGSQKGDFSVLIIFTREEVEDSSVICQMNITNL